MTTERTAPPSQPNEQLLQDDQCGCGCPCENCSPGIALADAPCFALTYRQWADGSVELNSDCGECPACKARSAEAPR